jgi:hypothetical protein
MHSFRTRQTEDIQDKQNEDIQRDRFFHRSLIRVLATFAIIIGLIHTADAAVAVQNAGFNDTGNGGATSVRVTGFTVSGLAKYLVVGVAVEHTTASPITVSGVTAGGSAMTFIGTRTNSNTASKNVRIEMWQLINPANATITITATMSASTKAVIGAVLFTGVNQTTPQTGFTSATGTGNASTLTVTSTAGAIVIDAFGRNDPSNTDPANTAVQFEQLDVKTNSVALGMSTRAGAAPNVNMQWATTGGGNDWSLGAISVQPLTPTLAHLKSFSAVQAKDGKVMVQWDTSYEVDNLGFNVYREQDGRMNRVSSQMIAGSALQAGAGIALTSGKTYSWTDKSTGDKRGARYWIEDVDLKGVTTLHGPIMVDNSKADSSLFNSRAEALTLKQMGESELNAEAEAFTPALEATAILPKLRGAKAAYEQVAAEQTGVKIAVKQTGWYKVTQPQLVAAGLPASIDPRKLQLYVDGRQVPMLVSGQADGRFDPNDSLEFFGVKLESPTTDQHVYWLVSGDTAGSRVNVVNAPASPTQHDSFNYTVELREHLIYFAALLNGDADNFLGQVVSSDPLNQTVSAANLDAAYSGSANLELSLQGVTELPEANDHQVNVNLNGNFIGTLVFDGRAKGVQSFSVPQALLLEQNVITLTSGSGAVDVSLVDYIRLTYRHKFAADQNKLWLNLNGSLIGDGATYSIDGFNTAAVRVFDVTNPDSPSELVGTVSGQGGQYTVSVKLPDLANHTLLAINETQFNQPASMKLDSVSNLRNKTNRADMLIITHGDFAGSSNSLVDLRKSQGIQAMVVDVENVYDEFSFGQKQPQAIKDFLAYTVGNWKKAPQFVLFVGDASFDPKNYMGLGESDFAPTKLIDTEIFQTASDDWFADFNNDGIPELYVGRLPGRSAGEISQIVSKIVAYDSIRRAGPVNKKVLLISDINDGFNFEASSMELRAGLPSGTNSSLILRSQNSDDKTHADILAAINSGQSVVNYLGHGSVGLIRGNLLSNADAAAMTNENSLSLFVMMTCLNGLFDEPTGESLAEAFLKANHGGAVAVWASAGICPPGSQTPMNQDLFNGLFKSTKPISLGEAVARAKASSSETDVRRTWILFGDPSMKLK